MMIQSKEFSVDKVETVLTDLCKQSNITLTKSQFSACEYLIHRMYDVSKQSKEKYNTSVTDIKLSGSYKVVFLSFDIEHLGLPETNLLRYVDRKHYLAKIGNRGKVTLCSYPESLKQFEGKTFLGFHIKTLTR